MHQSIEKFYAFVSRPLAFRSRLLLAALVIPLAFALTQPLWRISMTAPQYPGGLQLDIYAYKVDGGNDGQHVDEINLLNHYIGMHRIDREALSDLDWLPFALGAILLLALRVAALGDVRALLDLVIITGYVSSFAFARFIYKLYVFGHDLAPDAPVKVEPFMPVIIGSKQIANFNTQSYPLLGSVLLGIFVAGISLVAAWHLWSGRRTAQREEAEGALLAAAGK